MAENQNKRVTFSIGAGYYDLMERKTTAAARANLVSVIRASLLALDALPEDEQRRLIERGVKELDLE